MLDDMENVYTVSAAKVPICRFFDPELYFIINVSQLNCDININNLMSLRNTELVKSYVNIDPRVKQLLMLIKHWAKKRRLNDGVNCFIISCQRRNFFNLLLDVDGY